MRILIVTPNPPYPAHSGGALRANGILHILNNAGHEVTLLCFSDATTDLAATPLPRLCKRIVTCPPPTRTRLARLRHLAFSNQPDLVQRMASADMEKALIALCAEDFDVIQFEGLEMATYLPFAATMGTRAKLIYDSFNAEYALQQKIAQEEGTTLQRLPARLYSLIQARRIYALEAWLGEHADGYIAVSEEDAALLRPLRKSRALPIVPSGIFVADYQGSETTDLQQPALVFTGKMDYRPNVDAMLWYASEIMPHLSKINPSVQLYIVGQQPSPAVTALGEQPNITVTGKVPHVTPYLRSAAVYIAPLRMGSGTRLKLLEAMACGCAIVATDTAAAGLSAECRAAMHIAETADAFTHQIAHLLGSPTIRHELGEDARIAVQARYDWSVIAPQLLAVYAELGLN
jgi:polysaccharide biosynthesis protein PslH